MMPREEAMKIQDKMSRSLTQRAGNVILRTDLARLGSPTQVSKVISDFIKAGRLMRVSKGVFVKTRINRFTGKPAPAGTLETISGEIFEKLGVQVAPGRLAEDYNRGASNQIPGRFVVGPIGKRRIQRKIQVGDRIVQYEKNQRVTKN